MELNLKPLPELPSDLKRELLVKTFDDEPRCHIKEEYFLEEIDRESYLSCSIEAYIKRLGEIIKTHPDAVIELAKTSYMYDSGEYPTLIISSVNRDAFNKAMMLHAQRVERFNNLAKEYRETIAENREAVASFLKTLESIMPHLKMRPSEIAKWYHEKIKDIDPLYL